MQTFSIMAMALMTLLSFNVWAQDSSIERSGYYQELKLGVDSSAGTVTGFYQNGNDFPDNDNEPNFACTFYLSGKKSGDQYAIQVWRPRDKTVVPISGELSFVAPKKGGGKPSVRVHLKQSPPGCWDVNPDLAKAEGSHLTMIKNGAWTEVRMVKADKAHFWESPSAGAPRKDYMTRGSIFEVLQKQPGWLAADYLTKAKGWVKEEDVFPISPVN